MSDKNEKPKQASIAAPSPTWIRKILGEPLSQGTAQGWPELAGAWAGRQAEMPNESAKVSHLGEMGPLSRMRYPNAYAATGPFGSIKLNRDLIQKEGADINDVLVHELAHVGQGPMGFLKTLMGSSAPENDAINKEAFRKVRKTNIELPVPRAK